MSLVLIGLLIGALGGAVAALCGVGGGVVMVPLFVYALGLKQNIAAATSLAIIIPTAIAATVQNTRNDLVDWKVFAGTVVGAVVIAFFAAPYLKELSTLHLRRIFAVVMIVAGVQMLLQRSP